MSEGFIVFNLLLEETFTNVDVNVTDGYIEHFKCIDLDYFDFRSYIIFHFIYLLD